MGTKIFINFTKNSFEQNFDKLQKEIQSVAPNQNNFLDFNKIEIQNDPTSIDVLLLPVNSEIIPESIDLNPRKWNNKVSFLINISYILN